MECQNLMYRTVKAVTLFFADMIEQHNLDDRVLNYVRNLLTRWDYYWPNIEQWLINLKMTDEEETLLTFIQNVPALVPFGYMLKQSLKDHGPIWNAFYKNIVYCQNVLKELRKEIQ